MSDSATTLITLTSIAVSKYIFGVYIRWRRYNSFVRVGCVASLHCYPVKSCGGLQIEGGECTKLGVKGQGVTDRHWLVVKPNGDFITQRQEPRMAMIQINCHGDNLRITAEGTNVLEIPKQPKFDITKVIGCRVWGTRTLGMDCGDEASHWFSKFLGVTGLRLLYSASELEKRDASIDEKPWGNPAVQGDEVAFGDFCAYLVANTASLDHLNQKLDTPVPITNFRPNIVIQSDVPFDEDNWSEIKIGENVRLRMLDGCTRCQMTTIISSLGQKAQNGEPLKTLKTFRCFDEYGSSPIFGVNATVDSAGPGHIGDPVYAIRKDLYY